MPFRFSKVLLRAAEGVVAALFASVMTLSMAEVSGHWKGVVFAFDLVHAVYWMFFLGVFLASATALYRYGFNACLNRLEETLIALLIASATMLIFIAVVHRYGTGFSINASKWATAQGFTGLAAVLFSSFKWFSSWDLSWSQELCIILFVWMAKIGAAYGVRTGAHVGVDVVTNMITGASRYWVICFGMLAGAIFTFIIGTFGVDLVSRMYATGQQTNDLEVPQWIVYMGIPVGSYLMSFRFMQVLYNFARTAELPHTDESHVDGLDEVVPAGIATTPAHAPAGAMTGTAGATR